MCRASTSSTARGEGGDRPGWRYRRQRVGDRLGAERIGASLYDLPPGQRMFPFYFDYGEGEWLFVLSGRPTLRTPAGERELAPGDAVCFRAVPEGAHQVVNCRNAPARVFILSTLVEPSVVVYPDSDKLGTGPGVDRDRLNFPRRAAVDYSEAESVEG